MEPSLPDTKGQAVSVQGPGRIDLDELKAAIDIAELAQSLGLTVKGKSARCYNAQAHAHGDRTPSLSFYKGQNGAGRYQCFACGVSGTALDLYMAVRGVDLQTAVRELAELYGLTPRPSRPMPTRLDRVTAARELAELYLTPRPSGPMPTRRPSAAGAGRAPTPATSGTKGPASAPDSELYEALAAYCGGPDPEALAYLTGPKRGLTAETVRRFGLFTVKDYSATERHLLDRFGRDRCTAAGILSEAGRLIFYRHRLLIPYTQGGRVLFLQGRRLDEGVPKYLNLTGVSTALFNLDRLGTLAKGARVYLAEGAFDAMALEQYGRPALGVIGIGGFKAEWAEILAPFDVCLVYDNPKPSGTPEERAKEAKTLAKAEARLAELFLRAGRVIRARRLPAEFKDLTDYLVANPNYPTPRTAPAETPAPGPAQADNTKDKLASVFGQIEEVQDDRQA